MMFGPNRSDWMSQMFRNELRNFLGDTARETRWRRARQARGVFPAVNLYDDGESFLMRAELPGVDLDDLDISAKADQVVIRGERTIETPEAEANLHRREREGGTFRRALSLPQRIDPEKVSARFKHGVLEVLAPRAADQRPRKVEIES
ncbi:MAG: Hsp20/alpha crystallin family protein [Persicimonas sp.]